MCNAQNENKTEKIKEGPGERTSDEEGTRKQSNGIHGN
jgi:hypothetical protein